MLSCAYTSSLALWAVCLSVARKTGIQSQVESYQRFIKRYLIPPCYIQMYILSSTDRLFRCNTTPQSG